MRLNILSEVQHDQLLLTPGMALSLPEEQALALIRAKAAEPVGRAAIAVWAAHAAADLTALQLEEVAIAARGAVPEIPYIGGRSRLAPSIKGGSHA